MNVVLYTQEFCPQCEGIKRLLKQKGISYMENRDVDEMAAKGITHTPMMEVDGEMMSATNAINWINSYGN